MLKEADIELSRLFLAAGREQLHDAYAEAVWSRDFMRSAGRNLDDIQDGFTGIALEDLYAIGRKIYDQSSLQDVYTVLAGPSPRPETSWYDVLYGPQHEPVAAMVTDAVSKQFPGTLPAGIDIATGTGRMIPALATCCNQVTAVDMNPAMLAWAGKKLEQLRGDGVIEGYSALVADARQIGDVFRPGSFWLVIDNGLFPYLSETEESAYFAQVHRMVADYGYYVYFAQKNSQKLAEASAAIYQSTGRARLAGEVVSGVMSHSHISGLKKPRGRRSILKSNGFEYLAGFDYPEQAGAVYIWQKT